MLQRSAMLHFCPLASGSKGNSLYIRGASTQILIDAGLSCRQLEQRLADIQVSLREIDAIVITHEHIDHITSDSCEKEIQ